MSLKENEMELPEEEIQNNSNNNNNNNDDNEDMSDNTLPTSNPKCTNFGKLDMTLDERENKKRTKEKEEEDVEKQEPFDETSNKQNDCTRWRSNSFENDKAAKNSNSASTSMPTLKSTTTRKASNVTASVSPLPARAKEEDANLRDGYKVPQKKEKLKYHHKQHAKKDELKSKEQLQCEKSLPTVRSSMSAIVKDTNTTMDTPVYSEGIRATHPKQLRMSVPTTYRNALRDDNDQTRALHSVKEAKKAKPMAPHKYDKYALLPSLQHIESQIPLPLSHDPPVDSTTKCDSPLHLLINSDRILL
ncbi:hypothetical protein RFI_09575 [Reticulomyxa filosa]|uniref:Uncharacterized protein n=1 Tax=Reticulomyxa filosa TaxID=46433 RepID=X6NNI1_RETFI|nr:hypothetical protein RFI_09575 [Reticulomyxa filosa]|eukprot:ETO27556.1 hypothetical protein RFI_09575 [Reticulomyxa filosa]